MVVDEDMAMGGHVDHAVVGRDEQARATGHPCLECRQCAVELFEDREPAAGLPAVGVRGLVELGDVEVDERRLAAGDELCRLGEAIGDRCRRPVLGAAQHRMREAGVAVARRSDRVAGDALGGRRLEQRREPAARSRAACRRPSRSAGSRGDHVRSRAPGIRRGRARPASARWRSSRWPPPSSRGTPCGSRRAWSCGRTGSARARRGLGCWRPRARRRARRRHS